MSDLTDHISDEGLMLLHQMYSQACLKLAHADNIAVYTIKANLYYNRLLERVPNSHKVELYNLVQSLPTISIARRARKK